MSDGYVCCFCGADIEKEDAAALHLIATNLWKRDPAQSVYAHSRCAAAQMAAGQLEPEVLRDSENGYSVQEIVWGEDEGKGVQIPGWGCLAIAVVIVAAGYALARLVGL
ncbi:hypothetical protein [Sphingomonas sp. ID1715]|uniref:hypothetical protein n=1 Tax=Sphingomonas sp. ID1715 TaxID=1656898 RepID=UPI001583A03D|nr:hypothetical protein [Sphingomonas sp. ID1715]